MPDNDIMRLPTRPSKTADGESAGPTELFDEGPNQAEVFRDLAAHLAVFLAIALAASLLVRILGGG